MSELTAWRDDQDWPSRFQDQAGGIECKERIGALAPVADDQEIGSPRLSCDCFGGNVQERPPFRMPAGAGHRGTKVTPLQVEQTLHILLVRLRRRRLTHRLVGQEQRHRLPCADANQMRAKAFGEFGGDGHPSAQLTFGIDVHHQCDVGHDKCLSAIDRTNYETIIDGYAL